MTSGVRTSLAELAAASAAARVLEQHGLDYWCQGGRPLEEAAREKGLDPGAVLQEISEAQAASADERDWREAPLSQLIEHIRKTHHEYLKRNLPALSQRLAEVVEVHRARDAARLEGMSEVFAGLRAELEGHMQKEEVILFPVIARYEQAASQGLPVPPVAFGTIANPIRVMEREHSSAAEALKRLRELAGGYCLPDWACETTQALWRSLEELERDLHLHIHLENNILFPRATDLEGRTCGPFRG